MPEWTLLSNHGLTLLTLAEKPEATTRELSNYLGMTERSVQRIIADLDAADCITRKRVGRRNRYKVNSNLPIHHPLKEGKTIGHLLAELADMVPEGKL